MTIDLEKEVIRSGPFDDGFWTKWTYQFTPLYPRGQVKKVAIQRRAGFAINVTFEFEGKAAHQLCFRDDWRKVEVETRQVLSKYNCRPFRLDEP